MIDSLAELLRRVPQDVFWRTGRKGARAPNFNGTFGWCLRSRYANGLPAAEQLVIDIETCTKLPNLTTFQRAVSKEARHREGRG